MSFREKHNQCMMNSMYSSGKVDEYQLLKMEKLSDKGYWLCYFAFPLVNFGGWEVEEIVEMLDDFEYLFHDVLDEHFENYFDLIHPEDLEYDTSKSYFYAISPKGVKKAKDILGVDDETAIPEMLWGYIRDVLETSNIDPYYEGG